MENVQVLRLRDAANMVLSSWAASIVIAEDNVSTHVLLPYFFGTFFLLDFLIQTKPDFKVHHFIRASLFAYSVATPIPNLIALTVLATDVSTPLSLVIKYIPFEYSIALKILFVPLFYVTRIHQFALHLLTMDVSHCPHHEIFVVLLLALFALNVHWFILLLTRITPPARACVAAFVFYCTVVK